jgi:glyoxylase-like metal-dependent hydrolase (beta-lactamase superfamily II)
VLVGEDAGCLLVDPGVTTRELDTLAAAVAARGLRPVGRFATHPHWDHVLTTDAWADVPAWWGVAPEADGRGARIGDDPSSWRDEVTAERDADAELTAVAPGDRPAILRAPPAPAPAAPDPDGLRLAWPGPRTLVLATPGHAPCHASLWLPGPRVLIAGDLLSDTEVPLLDPSSREPVREYAATLDALEALRPALVVPGHGSVARGPHVAERLAADRAYLRALVAGRDPVDPRLGTPWVAAEHARQRAALGG